MRKILETICSDIESTEAIIKKLNADIKKSKNSADLHSLNEKLMVAEDMLSDLHRKAAEVEKYIAESENRK